MPSEIEKLESKNWPVPPLFRVIEIVRNKNILYFLYKLFETILAKILPFSQKSSGQIERNLGHEQK